MKVDGTRGWSKPKQNEGGKDLVEWRGLSFEESELGEEEQKKRKGIEAPKVKPNNLMCS